MEYGQKKKKNNETAQCTPNKLPQVFNDFCAFLTNEFSNKDDTKKIKATDAILQTLLAIIAGSEGDISASDKIKAISLYKEFLEMFFSDLRNDDKI